MQPKQIFLLIAICSFTFTATAQEYQLYKEIGKKVKVLTLSNGKYDEFFDYKDVQRIGSVMFNIRTKKIVKLLNADSIFKKFSNNSSASRWYSPDPLSDKFASLTPYNFVENNPINKIDPDGMEAKDWFKDKNGVMQFDPLVKSQADLKDPFMPWQDKGTYVGETKTETSSRGSKVDYRKDGSILYNNENDAYDRMKTIGLSKEAMAVNIGKQTLYLPDYNNNLSTSETSTLGYELKNGKINDPVTGSSKTITFSIHTHNSLYKGVPWGDDNASPSDKYKFAKETPNIPFLTIGTNNIFGYFGNWKPGKDNKYHYEDAKTFQFMQIPTTQLYNGLKAIVNQNRSKYGNY